MKSDKYTVYMHTSPNRKVYVGMTRQTLSARWAKGKGYRTNDYFTRAINKYGWDNFKHETIANNLSFEETCELEKKLIAEHRSDNEEFGYNHSKGGDNSFARDKQDLHYGKSPKARAVVQYTMDGKKIAEWESTTKARDVVGIDYTAIVRCCRNQCKYGKGFLWFYKGEDTPQNIALKVEKAKQRYCSPMSEEHRKHISEGVIKHYEKVGRKNDNLG